MAETRTRIATKTVDLEVGAVSWEFADGSDPIVFHYSEFEGLAPIMLVHAALHGISQTGGDAYSGEKDVAEARNKLLERLERIRANEWTARRAPGEGSTTLVVEAVANLQGLTTEVVKETWAKLDEETQKNVRKMPEVKAEMARIKAERLASQAKDADETGLTNLFSSAA